MAYSRPITRPLKTLVPPSMGQDLNSPNDSNPSSFNDIANQYRAIDESGWVAVTANSRNMGGRLRPLCGDFGPTFTHTITQTIEINFELPQIFRSFSFVTFCRSCEARQDLAAHLQIDRGGILTTQLIFFKDSASLGGSNARPWMEYGGLPAAFYQSSTGVNDTGVKDAKLILTSTKVTAVDFGGSVATGQGNFYADGFLSVALKLFR